MSSSSLHTIMAKMPLAYEYPLGLSFPPFKLDLATKIYNTLDLPSLVNFTTNPYYSIRQELDNLDESMKDLMGVKPEHPVLQRAAEYYFDQSGKHLRPAIILLLSQALAANQRGTYPSTIIEKESFPDIPNDSSSQSTDYPTEYLRLAFNNLLNSSPKQHPNDITPRQYQLAQITEMIHTASLIHDDIIDNSKTRRNKEALQILLGNKRSVLAGDFLLANASILLAKLHNVQAIELISRSIGHLVQGEFMQLVDIDFDSKAPRDSNDSKSKLIDSDLDPSLMMDLLDLPALDHESLCRYLRKCFFKTASLFATSSSSTALVGGHPKEMASLCYSFGKHLGIAFQIVDDMLDFESSSAILGKPSNSDLANGIITAPVYICQAVAPEKVTPILDRQLSRPGDVETLTELVLETGALEKTKHLALLHSQQASALIGELVPSVGRNSLLVLIDQMLSRTK